MELQELRYFIQIAKDKNYTKAAAHLYVSQPALSRSMKKLENEFQVPLFDVRPGGVFLTDYGQLLFDHSVRLISEFNSLKNIVQDVQSFQFGNLNIGVTPMINTLFLEQIVTNFKQMFPDIKLNVIERGNNLLRQQLSDGVLDLVLCIADEPHSALDEQPLFENEMVVCLSESHHLAKNTTISFKELKEEAFNFYTVASTLYGRIQTQCKKYGFAPKPNFTSSNVDSVIRFTANGSGVCIFTRLYAETMQVQGLRLIPLQEPLLWVPCLLKNKTVYQSEASKRFAAYVCDFFSHYQDAEHT